MTLPGTLYSCSAERPIPGGVGPARPGELSISTRLFVRHMGEAGPVILLLHGLGASGRSWRLVAERLAGTHRIVCSDLLGFGRSLWPHAAYTVAGHLTTLEATFDALVAGHSPVLLAGHSTGAVVALEWAAAQPERFRGVLLTSLPAYRSADEARACITSRSPLAWATVARPDLGELICAVICAERPLWRMLMPLLMPRVPAGIARDMALQILTGQTHSLLVNAPRTCAGVLAALEYRTLLYRLRLTAPHW